jgi:hypothetical protein
MESLETVGWLMMSFIPSLLLMEIGCRIGKGKVVITHVAIYGVILNLFTSTAT